MLYGSLWRLRWLGIERAGRIPLGHRWLLVVCVGQQVQRRAVGEISGLIEIERDDRICLCGYGSGERSVLCRRREEYPSLLCSPSIQLPHHQRLHWSWRQPGAALLRPGREVPSVH